MASDAYHVTKRLLKSTRKAAWIAGTTFLILALPLIIEMDREQQLSELELQQIFEVFGSIGLRITPASNTGGTRELAYEEGQLERPRWTGDTPISRLVGALISFKPLFSVLKLGAKQVLISTAEKTNIPWRDMTREILDSSDVYKEMDTILDPSVLYPDYYLNPFHAYDEGNLSWLVALGAARGLAYLHSPEAKVIYRDFKSGRAKAPSRKKSKK